MFVRLNEQTATGLNAKEVLGLCWKSWEIEIMLSTKIQTSRIKVGSVSSL